VTPHENAPGMPADATRGEADSNRASDLTRLARGGLLNVAGSAFAGLAGFGFVVVMAHALGTSGAGAFFETVAVFSILTIVAQLGSPTALVRSIAQSLALERIADVRPTITFAMLPVAATSTALAAALFFTAPQLVGLVINGADRSDAVFTLRCLAPFLPVAAVGGMLVTATQGFGTMVPNVVIGSFVRPLLRVALALPLLWGAVAARYASITWSVPLAVGAAMGAYWIFRCMPRPRGASDAPVSPSLWREFWRFALFLSIADTFEVVVLWLDVLLVGTLASSSAAGVYTAAGRYAVVGFMLLGTLIAALGPQVSTLMALREYDRARAVYQAASLWLTAVGFPIYLACVVFAPVLMGVFGTGFSTGATALMIIALAMLVNMATGPVRMVLIMGGHSGWTAFNDAVALVANVGLNLLLIPDYGITGAAIAWAASILITNIAPLIQIWALWRMMPFGAGFVPVSMAAVCCFGLLGLAVRAVAGTSPATFTAYAVIATLTYGVLLWLLRDVLQLDAIRRGIAFRSPGGAHPSA
jgi:O-antigen/teichoic acid export membrane protein